MDIVRKAPVDFGKGIACQRVIAVKCQVLTTVAMMIHIFWDMYAV